MNDKCLTDLQNYKFKNKFIEFVLAGKANTLFAILPSKIIPKAHLLPLLFTFVNIFHNFLDDFESYSCVLLVSQFMYRFLYQQ